MKKQQIESIVYSEIPKKDIKKLKIVLGNNYIPQIDQLEIIFANEVRCDYILIGKILDKLENYTMEDGYGDITGIKIEYSNYYEFPKDENIYNQIIIDFEIDS